MFEKRKTVPTFAQHALALLALRVSDQRGHAVETVDHLGIGRGQEEGEAGAEVQRQKRGERGPFRWQSRASDR